MRSITVKVWKYLIWKSNWSSLLFRLKWWISWNLLGSGSRFSCVLWTCRCSEVTCWFMPLGEIDVFVLLFLLTQQMWSCVSPAEDDSWTHFSWEQFDSWRLYVDVGLHQENPPIISRSKPNEICLFLPLIYNLMSRIQSLNQENVLFLYLLHN